MNSKTIYEQIYNRLVKLIPNLEKMEVDDHQVSKVSGYMDLCLNILSKEKKEQCRVKVISLTHYYEQNSDLVPDPDMTIRIYSRSKMAKALTFQDFFGFQTVYPTPTTFNPKLKTQLNLFLNSWLNNCIKQGHQFGRSEKI